MDEFTQAYVECALWSSNDESDEAGGRPMDENYDIDDIAAETLAKMVADCERFQRENADALAEVDMYADGRAGHDFWLTRNRHGAGFWDGDWPEPAATRLTDAAQAFGEMDLYVGDDNKIH